MASTAAVTGGRLASTVAATPIRAYPRAQNGKASGSLLASAAVPKPCAAPAVASPRAIGSRYPAASRSACAQLAPSNPVSTTPAAAIDAGAPSASAMGRASATVTDLGTSALEISGDRPRTWRAAAAVANIEKAAEPTAAPPISSLCLAIRPRCAWMRKPYDRMTTPSSDISTSPAPAAAPPAPLVRYEASAAS